MIEEGKSTEAGKHRELVEGNGKYTELYRIQLSQYHSEKGSISITEYDLCQIRSDFLLR